MKKVLAILLVILAGAAAYWHYIWAPAQSIKSTDKKVEHREDVVKEPFAVPGENTKSTTTEKNANKKPKQTLKINNRTVDKAINEATKKQIFSVNEIVDFRNNQNQQNEFFGSVYIPDLNEIEESAKYGSKIDNRRANNRSIFILKNKTETQIQIESLQFNPYFGLEADFADLNSAKQGQESALNKVSEVDFREGEESAALMVNIVGLVPITERSSFFATLGLNAWQIEEGQLNSTLSGDNSVRPIGSSDSQQAGADMFYGIGFKYDYGDFTIKSEIQIYQLEGEDIEVYSIGGGFAF
mgnify:CR=1 FL=1